MRVILTPPRGKTWIDVPPRPIEGSRQSWLSDNKKGVTIWANQLPSLQEWAKKEGVDIQVTER